MPILAHIHDRTAKRRSTKIIAHFICLHIHFEWHFPVCPQLSNKYNSIGATGCELGHRLVTKCLPLFYIIVQFRCISLTLRGRHQLLHTGVIFSTLCQSISYELGPREAYGVSGCCWYKAITLHGRVLTSIWRGWGKLCELTMVFRSVTEPMW